MLDAEERWCLLPTATARPRFFMCVKDRGRRLSPRTGARAAALEDGGEVSGAAFGCWGCWPPPSVGATGSMSFPGPSPQRLRPWTHYLASRCPCAVYYLALTITPISLP